MKTINQLVAKCPQTFENWNNLHYLLNLGNKLWEESQSVNNRNIANTTQQQQSSNLRTHYNTISHPNDTNLPPTQPPNQRQTYPSMQNNSYNYNSYPPSQQMPPSNYQQPTQNNAPSDSHLSYHDNYNDHNQHHRHHYPHREEQKYQNTDNYQATSSFTHHNDQFNHSQPANTYHNHQMYRDRYSEQPQQQSYSMHNTQSIPETVPPTNSQPMVKYVYIFFIKKK